MLIIYAANYFLHTIAVFNEQDQGSKAPETSPFHKLNIEPSMYSTHFVCIPRVLELL